jgi:hypothetical protein
MGVDFIRIRRCEFGVLGFEFMILSFPPPSPEASAAVGGGYEVGIGHAARRASVTQNS